MKKKSILSSVFIMLFWGSMFLSNIAEAGDTYYVATDGSDTSSDCSSASPCATVKHVLSNKINAGDTIIIKPGDYTEKRIYIDNTTKHDNITITSEYPNDRPHFKGTDNSTCGITIEEGVTGVTIANLRIRYNDAPYNNWTHTVIIKAEPATVDNCEIYNGFGAIYVDVTKNITIKNCYLHDGGAIPSDGSKRLDAYGVGLWNFDKKPVAAGWHEKIHIYNTVIDNFKGDAIQDTTGQYGPTGLRYVEVENCVLANSVEQGFDSKGTGHLKIHGCDIYGNGYGGIGTNASYGPHPDWEIYNNKIHDHKSYAIFPQGGEDNWEIYNNLIYNNIKDATYNYPAVTLPPGGTSTFHHNTVYNNSRSDTSSSKNSSGLGPNDNGDNVVNNAFFNNGRGHGGQGNIRNISDDSGIPSHNYVYPIDKGQIGDNAVTVPDLIFTDTANRVFTLKAGSPLIDKGKVSPYNVDFNGVERPFGTGFDMGAYECTTSAPPSVLPSAPQNLIIVQ